MGKQVMRAAVYRGRGKVGVEEVEMPRIREGELLLKVEACGVCGTDLKKIFFGLVPPPRIFGHEIAATVAEVGEGVTSFQPGDRVVVFHHIPCEQCLYCREGAFAQCETFKKTGTTAGFEPAGGGFAEFVRVMDWIVEKGVLRIPDGISFEEASFVEPVNTCLKAIEKAEVKKGQTVLIIGLGPNGLILLQLAKLRGAHVIGSDPISFRRAKAKELGADAVLNPEQQDVVSEVKKLTQGRGADAAIVAAPKSTLIAQALASVRSAGRVVLFGQTVRGETAEIDVGSLCADEKILLGNYSASIALNQQAADLVFSRTIDVRSLITHVLPLQEISLALDIAIHPTDGVLKVLVKP